MLDYSLRKGGFCLRCSIYFQGRFSLLMYRYVFGSKIQIVTVICYCSYENVFSNVSSVIVEPIYRLLTRMSTMRNPTFIGRD